MLIFLQSILTIVTVWDVCTSFNLYLTTKYNRTHTKNYSFPYGSFRLPKNILPTHYDISIMPNWFNTTADGAVQTFDGVIKIQLTVQSTTNFIVLNAKDINIENVTLLRLRLNHTKQIAIQSISTDNDRQEMIYIALSEDVRDKEKLILNLQYSTIMGLNRLGFYRGAYINSEGKSSYIYSTQFSPNNARRAFPCFDEPGFKASFHISIVRPSHLSSLSNMPLKESRKIIVINDSYDCFNLFQDIYEPTLLMSTYLIAFVIHDYPAITSQTTSNIQVSVYTPADLIDQAHFVLSLATKGLEYYEDYFGINYPLPKLDLIGVPDFYFGAMENWGLMTVRLIYLLYSPNVSNSFKQTISILILHELAHQWFGNLVTMKWWDDLWLKEGFATYMSYQGLDAIYPDWQILNQLSNELIHNAMLFDGKSGSHPIRQDVNDANEILSIFDTISYNKGALLIRMLDGTVMDKQTFKKGLQNYLRAYAYGNSESHDLWEMLQIAYNKTHSKSVKSATNIENFVSSWINQKGFPIVTISDPYRATSGNYSEFAPSLQLQVSQTKFGPQFPGMNFEVKDKTHAKWHIPINIEYGDDLVKERTVIWLKNASTNQNVTNFNLGKFWVKGNLKFAGFYLVQYGVHIWNALVSRFKDDLNTIEAIDRAQLIDNLWLLQEFGYTPLVNVLDFLQYMQPNDQNTLEEDDPIPLSSLLDILFSVTLKFADLNGLVKESWNSVIIKLYIEPLALRYVRSKNLSHIETLIQSRLVRLALVLDHEPVIKTARYSYEHWLKASPPSHSILPPPDLTYATLLAGVRFGNEEDWQLVWNAYLTTNVPSMKNMMLSSLGTTKFQNLLLKYLNLTIDERNFIKAQDTIQLFSVVSSNPSPGCRELAWNFMRNHWDILASRLGHDSRSLQALVNSIASNFGTITQLLEYNIFVLEHLTKVPERSLIQTRQSIQSNIGWIEKNIHSLEQWLLLI